ncbi:MAG: PaaI family thioesterase [Roseovarius sp.]
MPDTYANTDAVSPLPAFPKWLGVTLQLCTADKVVGQMHITADHANRNGVLHGGAMMAFADSLGGTAASANLSEGQRTTTVESKTNFLRAVRLGETITGTCTPLHRGRRTTVWQTEVTRQDGKTAAVILQTQLTLEP